MLKVYTLKNMTWVELRDESQYGDESAKLLALVDHNVN